jgi:branched-chain amino acid transport system ATP-binding protein
VISLKKIIEVQNLNAGYGPIQILYDLNFFAPDGKITAIVGPNGTGKSTLIKSLIGLATIFSGKILFKSKDITYTAPHLRTRLGIGYMPQIGNIFAPLSVEENFLMASYIIDKRKYKDRLDNIFLNFPDLKEAFKKGAWKLSGGQRQMLSAGMVLMRNPDVMLVDEPTAGLMPKLVDELLDNFRKMSINLGLPIIIIEQHARKALEVSDQAYMMRGGKFIYEGSAEGLLEHELLEKMYLGEFE